MTPQDAPAGGRSGRARQRVRGRQAARRATFPFINSQIIAVADTGDLALTVSTIEAYVPEMNLVNVSTALHRLAKLTAGDPRAQLSLRRHPAFAALLAAARAMLERSRAGGASPHCQALSNITWALATVQHADLALLEAAAQLARGRVESFKPFELSATLWAFAKLDAVDPTACQCAADLFLAAAEYIPAHADLFSFRCLVMISWAFATARHHDGRLFHGIASRMLPMVPTANCQELANAAWAFSTAGVRHERLLSELARKSLQQLGDFRPQELSNVLWGFAASGFFHEELFVSAARAAQYLELQGQQLANVLWALSRLRPRHRAVQAAVLALLPRCTGALASLKPQELASAALAAAKCFGRQGGGPAGQDAAGRAGAPQQVAEFFGALARAAPPPGAFSGQSLANLAWSFSAMQEGCDTELLPGLAREAAGRAGELEPSALLLLLRTLPTIRNDVCDGSARLLFAEAARRVDVLLPKELHVLSRICFGLLGFRPGNERGEASAQELRRACQALAQAHSWTVAPLDEVDCQDDVLLEAGGSPGGWNAAEPAGGRAAEPPRGGREGAKAPPPGAGAGAPRPGARLAGGAPAPLVPYVKNTFLHVDDEKTPGHEDEEGIALHLPPSLGIIPDTVSPEKLAAYRADYQRFRAGGALGARGELCGGGLGPEGAEAEAEAAAGAAAEGAAPGAAPGFHPRHLPPPLDFMPRYISLEKLEAYRLDYQKFRAGNTTGAKGEISSRVAHDEDAGTPGARLPPPLDIIPRDVSPRKLEAYRLDYQRFRAGNAVGAKGEVAAAVAVDEPHFIALDKLLAYRPERLARQDPSGAQEAASGATSSTTPPEAAQPAPGGAAEAAGAGAARGAAGEAETDEGGRPELQVALSVKNTFLHFEASCEGDECSSPEGQDSVHVAKLPPPLKIIPGDVSAEKLEAYRMDYHKFRAGNAVGAKGEVSSSVAEGP